MGREISPKLSRLLSDEAFAQTEYERTYGTGRKPLADLTSDYRRRILKALSEGKTKQQGRGHTPRGGVSDYERRVSRVQAQYGVSPSQLTELRRLAAETKTDWDDVQVAINRSGSDVAMIRKALRDKKTAIQAYMVGDKTVGKANMDNRKNYLPIAFYYYNMRI